MTATRLPINFQPMVAIFHRGLWQINCCTKDGACGSGYGEAVRGQEFSREGEMGAPNRVPLIMHWLCSWIGQCMEISISVLQKWRWCLLHTVFDIFNWRRNPHFLSGSCTRAIHERRRNKCLEYMSSFPRQMQSGK